LTVGVIASVVGLATGIGVATGLKKMMSAMGIDLPGGSITITSTTVIVSVVAGITVSLVSALFPARRASKVPPIAALRDVAIDRSGSSRTRIVSGVTVTGLGGAAMAAGLFGGASIAAVGAGAALVFLGVAVLGPILARPISRVLGAPLPRLRGMAGNLARENAMRNPKRTSTTAAALMIGVALVGFITILASSTNASVAKSVKDGFTGDLVVSSGNATSGGLSTELGEQLATLPELEATSGLRMAAVRVDGSGANLVGADPVALQQILDLGVTDGSLADIGPGTIAISNDRADKEGWVFGDSIQVEFTETGTQQLRIAALYEEELAGDYIVGLDTFEANVADQFDRQVLMTVADGYTITQARAAITQLTNEYPQAEVQDRDEFIEAKTAGVKQILNLVYALLALAVFIALLGIANTLALSIFERTRELGLLRAVGMTRQQLRATVRWEAMIIALLGTVLGLTIGTGFGWAIVKALEDDGLNVFQVPAAQLGVIAVIAAVAGVGAAVLPARRAAKLNVLGAITTD
jgi:putative ABC transport system permease protein